MAELLYKLLACHMLGDYVLQTDFLAKTKGDNWWHLLAHCMLYTVPFALAFGIDWRIGCVLCAHFSIDALRARWSRISYMADQTAHLVTLAIYIV